MQSIAGAIAGAGSEIENREEAVKLNHRLEELKARQDALIAQAVTFGTLDDEFQKQCEQVNAEMTEIKERLRQIDSKKLAHVNPASG